MATLVLTPNLGHAELYLAGQMGVNLPQDLTDLKGVGASSGLTLSDLKLKKSVVFGGKFGGYFPGRANWLGLEVEAYHTNPDIKQQPATVSAPVFGISLSGTLPAMDLSITTVAFNGVVRYPGQMFQPYAGVGVGLNIAELSGGAASNEFAFSPTLNVLAGIRLMVHKKVGIFAEFKHNRGTFTFEDNEIEADYATNMVVGGVSIHFQ